MTTSSVPAGWYPDPGGGSGQRYFDGTQWTEHRSDVPAHQGLSREQLAQRLDAAVAEYIRYGGRVESHTAYHAVIVYENKPGPAAHILLGFLTLFTCGLFLIVWIIVAASASERRVTLRVDEFGNVTAS